MKPSKCFRAIACYFDDRHGNKKKMWENNKDKDCVVLYVRSKWGNEKAIIIKVRNRFYSFLKGSNNVVWRVSFPILENKRIFGSEHEIAFKDEKMYQELLDYLLICDI